MEIPVLSRLSGFGAEIIRLHNPSFVSRMLQFSSIEEAIKVRSFWTWGALILAVLAYFSSFVSRIKFVIYRLRKGKSQPLLQHFYDEDDDDEEDEDEDEDDETCSVSSSDESNFSEYESEDESVFENQRRFDEDYRVAGLEQSNRSFSWSDFVNGKSVVKSWDGLALGLGFEKASESLISLWDSNRNDIINSFSGQIPAITMPSPAVIVSAGFETSRNVALRVFDTRVGRQIPQMFAEWQQPNRQQKYVGDNPDEVTVRSVVVRDLRKITSPLENLTEGDVKRWWDSDAVIVNGDRDICCGENGCESVVSRCRNAVFSSLF